MVLRVIRRTADQCERNRISGISKGGRKDGRKGWKRTSAKKKRQRPGESKGKERWSAESQLFR